MLCAWVVARSDEGLGYVVGVAKIAAMILMNISPMQGFIVLRNVLERHCLRSFYGGMSSKDDVSSLAYYHDRRLTWSVIRLKHTIGMIELHVYLAVTKAMQDIRHIVSGWNAEKYAAPPFSAFDAADYLCSLLQLQTTPNITSIVPSRLVGAAVPRSPAV